MIVNLLLHTAGDFCGDACPWKSAIVDKNHFCRLFQKHVTDSQRIPYCKLAEETLSSVEGCGYASKDN